MRKTGWRSRGVFVRLETAVEGTLTFLCPLSSSFRGKCHQLHAHVVFARRGNGRAESNCGVFSCNTQLFQMTHPPFRASSVSSHWSHSREVDSHWSHSKAGTGIMVQPLHIFICLLLLSLTICDQPQRRIVNFITHMETWSRGMRVPFTEDPHSPAQVKQKKK